MASRSGFLPQVKSVLRAFTSILKEAKVAVAAFAALVAALIALEKFDLTHSWTFRVSAGLAVLVLAFLIWEAVAAQRKARNDAKTRERADQPAPAESAHDYFRIGPYEEEDSANYRRGDGKDEEVRKWIEADGPPLRYLVGDSGVGKSSLLAAGVVPALRKTLPGVLILRYETYERIEEDLGAALRKPGFLWTKSPAGLDELSLTDLLARAAEHLAAKKRRLLIVLDQFETVPIRLSSGADQLPQLRELLAAFGATGAPQRFPGCTLLLSIRTDYEERLWITLNLPESDYSHKHRNAWRLGGVDRSRAKEYLRKGLCTNSAFAADAKLLEGTIQNALSEASRESDSEENFRYIVLNLIGRAILDYISRHPGRTPPPTLLRESIAGFLRREVVREHAPSLLKTLVRSGYRETLTVTGLATATTLDPELVSGQLHRLIEWPLVRRISAGTNWQESQWQIVHDFVARILRDVLATPFVSLMARARAFLVPILLAGAVALPIVGFYEHQADRRKKEESIENAFAQFEGSMEFLPAEVAALWTIAGHSNATKTHLIQYAMVSDVRKRTYAHNADYLLHAILGLDFDVNMANSGVAPLAGWLPNEKSERYLSAQGEILAALGNKLDPDVRRLAATAILSETTGEGVFEHLPPLKKSLSALVKNMERNQVGTLASTVITAIKNDPKDFDGVGPAVAASALASNLNSTDAYLLADALLTRTEKIPKLFSSEERCEALAALAKILKTNEAQTLADRIMIRMKQELPASNFGDFRSLSSLGSMLAAVAQDLKAEDVRSGVATLLLGIKKSPSYPVYDGLGDALAALADKLAAKDVTDTVPILIAHGDDGGRYDFDTALAALAGEIDPHDASSFAKKVVGVLVKNPDSMPRAFASLTRKLDSSAAQPLAAALTEGIKNNPKTEHVLELGTSLGALVKNASSSDLQPGAQALLERMKNESSNEMLKKLGDTLAPLAGCLTPTDARSLAKMLIAKMREGDKGLTYSGAALAHLARILDPSEASAGAEAFIERIEKSLAAAFSSDFTNKLGPSYFLDIFGEPLAALAKRLESRESQRLVTRLINRIVDAPKIPVILEGFHGAITAFAARLKPNEVQALASKVVSRMESETHLTARTSLALILASLAGTFDPDEIRESLVPHFFVETRDDGFCSIVEKLHIDLSKLATKLALTDELRRGLRALELYCFSHDQPDLKIPIAAWVALDRACYGTAKLREPSDRLLSASHRAPRLQTCIEFLQHPIVVGKSRAMVVERAEELAGVDFQGDIWKFVAWATGPEGQKLGLVVKPRPYVPSVPPPPP
jgi:hypothetical protein